MTAFTSETPLRLTNSEMSTWRRCKRKWYFSHYRRLVHEGSLAGTPLIIGNRVHDALAAYYGGRLDPLERLRSKVEEDIVAVPVLEQAIRKDLDLCEAMVTGYLEWLAETGVDSDIRVLAPETKVEVPLNTELSINLLSKLDTRVERVSTGARLALEFKTCGSLTEPLPTLQIDTQLLTEHLAEFLDLRLRGEDANRAQGVLYRMLRKVKRTVRAKPPFFSEEEVPHNINELRNHWYHVLALARELQSAHTRLDAGESHQTVCYPSPRNTCSWDCPFLAACKLTDDGSDVEAYLASSFREGNPLERYENVTSWGDESEP